MSKSYFFVTILILFVHKVCSQKDSVRIYQVQYERTLDFNDGLDPLVVLEKYTKFIEFNKSLYAKMGDSINTTKIIGDKDDDTTFTFKPDGKNISVVFKDYGKRTFYSKHEIAYKYFVIKDSLDIFDWKILDKTKEILGLTCQMATMNFRGRIYNAWFATELPTGGPWKYDGLPGMILEIKSLDNFISYKAIAFSSRLVKLEELVNPFMLKNMLTWEEFKVLYRKKAIELTSFRPNENSLGIKSSRGGIEMYIDEDDMEYNAALRRLSNN